MTESEKVNIFEISEEEDIIEVLENAKDKLIVTMFSAPWCGPCKMMKPEFKKLSKLNPDVVFIYINVEKYKDDEYTFCKDVKSLPTFCLYLNLKKIYTLEGAEPQLLSEKVTQMQQIILKKIHERNNRRSGAARFRSNNENNREVKENFKKQRTQ